MKASINSSHHTVIIDDHQIDLFYEFDLSTMTFFVDGVHFCTSNFNPQRKALNYINIIDISATILIEHLKREERKTQPLESNQHTTDYTTNEDQTTLA